MPCIMYSTFVHWHRHWTGYVFCQIPRGDLMISLGFLIPSRMAQWSWPSGLTICQREPNWKFFRRLAGPGSKLALLSRQKLSLGEFTLQVLRSCFGFNSSDGRVHDMVNMHLIFAGKFHHQNVCPQDNTSERTEGFHEGDLDLNSHRPMKQEGRFASKSQMCQGWKMSRMSVWKRFFVN